MKDETKILILMFNMTNYDWLGFKVHHVDEYTFHHLIKDEDGGQRTINNGAVLCHKSHEYLHLIEICNRDIYNQLNNILIEINKQGYLPTKEQSKHINDLFNTFEKNKKNYKKRMNQKIYSSDKRKKMQLTYNKRKPRK